MMALTRPEKALSRTGRVRCRRQGGQLGREAEKGGETHLSAPKISVGSHVEDVFDEAVDGVPTDPEEDVLSVFDKEETVSFETLRGEGKRVGKNDALVRNGAALQKREGQYKKMQEVDGKTNLSGHVVKRIEDGVEVGDEELRRESGEETLSIGAHVGRNHRAVSETGLVKEKSVSFAGEQGEKRKFTHVLQQPEQEKGQELHVVAGDELRASSASARRHCRLVRPEKLDKLVLDGVPRVLELVRRALLDGLVGEEGGKGDLVDRGVELGDGGGGRKGQSDDSDATLAEGGGVKDGSLKYDEGSRDGILDLDLNGVRLVHRDGGKGEKVGRSDEEVAVESAHSDTYRDTWVSFVRVGKSGIHEPREARTRMTASRQIGSAMTVPNS